MARAPLSALLAAASVAVCAAPSDDPAYFVVDGNPAAVKYESGRLVRLPSQDAYDVEAVRALESVSALTHAPRLNGMTAIGRVRPTRLPPPQMPSYGSATFSSSPSDGFPLIWSGSTPFRSIPLERAHLDPRRLRALIAKSREDIGSRLDFRDYAPVGRRLEVDRLPRIQDYGHPVGSPELGIVDIIWHIKDLPAALSDRGIDSMEPFLRTEFVIDKRSDRRIFRNVSSGAARRQLMFIRERGGPLLMVTSIACQDGSEPFILDLKHESYGTGLPGDVTDISHCFPAQ